MCIISFAFYLFAILIKKLIGMYFFIDYAYAKGFPRNLSKALYSSSENYHHFVNFTVFLILSEVITGAVVSLLISDKGVAAFNTIQIKSSVLGHVFNGLTVVYVIYILKRIKEIT